MEIDIYERTLNPSTIEQGALFELYGKYNGDCLQAYPKQDTKGRPYNQYDLALAGARLNGQGNDALGDCVIRFLFVRDLQALREAFGKDSVQWVGKRVLLNSEEEKGKDGKVYTRWIIKPFLSA